MNLAHAERRPAFLLPLTIAALLAVALGLAVAAFVISLTDDDGGGGAVVREVVVTPAPAAPAHFAARPDESAVAASVGPAAKPSVSEQQAQYRYGTSQYRVNPSTGEAVPVFGSRADGTGSSHAPSQYESRGGDPSRPN